MYEYNCKEIKKVVDGDTVDKRMAYFKITIGWLLEKKKLVQLFLATGQLLELMYEQLQIA